MDPLAGHVDRLPHRPPPRGITAVRWALTAAFAGFVTLAAVSLILSLSLSCAVRDRTPAGAGDAYVGTLRGGRMAIGGETTGWVLERPDGSTLDVDVSGVDDPNATVDARVVIVGELRTRDYVERGPTPILHATAIRPVTAP